MSLRQRMSSITRRKPKPEVEETGDNRRFALRKNAQTPSVIVFQGRAQGLNCLVRDISSTGALVELGELGKPIEAANAHLPKTFTMLVGFDRTAFECQLMWTEGSRIGVRFLGLAKPTPKQPKQPKRPEKKNKKWPWSK